MVGPVELSWDRDSRMATMWFVEEGSVGRTEAEQLSAQLSEWVGDPQPDPYSLLVDCSLIVDVDAGWRATWAEHFQRHKEQATIAWFNANARIRLIILMFIKGTRVNGRSFATEAEARSWLDHQTEGR
jgi:hypothetical protein